MMVPDISILHPEFRRPRKFFRTWPCGRFLLNFLPVTHSFRPHHDDGERAALEAGRRGPGVPEAAQVAQH